MQVETLYHFMIGIVVFVVTKVHVIAFNECRVWKNITVLFQSEGENGHTMGRVRKIGGPQED